jgi:hypothetical protein
LCAGGASPRPGAGQLLELFPVETRDVADRTARPDGAGEEPQVIDLRRGVQPRTTGAPHRRDDAIAASPRGGSNPVKGP